jgi:hypothetical protein
MLWILGGVVLKFAEHIPFQSHAGVYRRRPVSLQKGVPEMLCMLLAYVFTAK